MLSIPAYQQRAVEETPLRWLLEALIHRDVPPRDDSFAQDAAPQEAHLMPPWLHQIEFNTPEAISRARLPDFNTSDMLPLAFWEPLFYATAAEIKFLYEDLQRDYGKEYEKGDEVLYQEQADGQIAHDVTAWDFLSDLESCWTSLTNPLLTSTLDFAVKQRHALMEKRRAPTFDEAMAAHGLRNISLWSNDHIMRTVAEAHPHRIKNAIRSGVVDTPQMYDLATAMDSRRAEAEEQRAQRERQRLYNVPESTTAAPAATILRGETGGPYPSESIPRPLAPATAPQAPDLSRSYPHASVENLRATVEIPVRSRQDTLGGSTQVDSAGEEELASRPPASQRYVSAGGFARLEEREVLGDDAIPGMPVGFSMPSEHVLARAGEITEAIRPSREEGEVKEKKQGGLFRRVFKK